MIGERIKKLRKALDLTQQGFCERIGVKRNTIAKYETNRGEPIDAVISLICREFNVSEMWLRTGEGEMFTPKEADAWKEVVQRRGLSSGDRLLIEKFMSLKPAERDVVTKYVLSVAAEYSDGFVTHVQTDTFQKELTSPAPDTSGQDRTQPDIAAELAELRRQNQELAAKVAAMEEEDALLGLTGITSPSLSVSAGRLSPVPKAKK